MIAVLLVLSCLLARFGSEWVDGLYRRQRSILEYPADEERRARRRCPLLALAFFFAALWLAWRLGGAAPFACAGAALPALPGAPDMTVGGLCLLSLLVRLIFLYFLLLTMATDWEQHVVFDRVLLPFALLALLFFPLLGWQALNHVLAAFAGGGAFLLLALLTRGGIGGGDIKLVFVLGLWLGTARLLAVLSLGFVLAGLVAALMLLARRWKRGERLAYSPYFSLIAIGLALGG